MCTEAIVNGVRVETQIELSKQLGNNPNNIKFLEEYGNKYCLEPKMCLCPVNFEKTAEHNDLNLVWHDWSDNWMGEAELTTKSADQP